MSSEDGSSWSNEEEPIVQSKNCQHRVYLQSIHAKRMLNVMIQHLQVLLPCIIHQLLQLHEAGAVCNKKSSICIATGTLLQMQGAQCTSTVLVHDHPWSGKAMHFQTEAQSHTRTAITPR